jgi:hypothetical protein
MKCIKNRTTGEIRRVTETVAYQMEKLGWGFIPKSEWKLTTRKEVVKTTEKVVNEEGKVRRNREKRNRK